jgi:hypothetical protein
MAFGKKNTSLIDTLGAKQVELLDSSKQKNDTAAAYVAQANVLVSEADQHKAHAKAVGEALDVLNKAGVQL